MNIDVKMLEFMGKHKIRTIKELREMTGLSRTVLSDLINNKKSSVRLDTIVKLCKAFDCEIGELIEVKKDKESEVRK